MKESGLLNHPLTLIGVSCAGNCGQCGLCVFSSFHPRDAAIWCVFNDYKYCFKELYICMVPFIKRRWVLHFRSCHGCDGLEIQHPWWSEAIRLMTAPFALRQFGSATPLQCMLSLTYNHNAFILRAS